MKNTFRGLLASGVAGLSLVANPAAAEILSYDATRLIELGVLPELAYTVEAANIPVIDGASFEGESFCSPQDEMVVFGFYNTKYNAIVMCSDNLTLESFPVIFTHEAIHVVQDCRAGLENTRTDSGTDAYIDALWADLHPDVQVNILEGYRPESYPD